MNSLIIDTGVVNALADENDAWYGKATEFVTGFTGRLVVPFSVIPECCYLLNSYLGQQAESAFLKSLIKRELFVEQLTHQDIGGGLLN